ncbi:MAG: helix-turn-helix domain-containing protein [Desulfobacteraceae bacterium]|nr:MAG: helix-turn-helix domain-containing protein [Desulfobacteraceae bacterium]
MEPETNQSIPQVDFLKRSDKPEIEILRFASLLKRRDHLDHSPGNPHRLRFYIIMVVTRGSGTHFIDFLPYTFDQGSIILVSKGQVHAFDFTASWDGFLIMFTDDFLSKHLIHSDILSLHKLYNYHLHQPVITPGKHERPMFENLIRGLTQEYEHPDDFAREELLKLHLKIFLLKIERFKQGQIPDNSNTETILTFMEYKRLIEQHYKETKNAKDYAQQMGISYKHLNAVCKRIAGHTAKQFIDGHVILEIKRHLATTGFSIKELAYEMGFDEPTNFVKFFSKHTRTTPAKFKQSLKI